MIKLSVARYLNVDGPYVTRLYRCLRTTRPDVSENVFRELYRSPDDVRAVQCCFDSCKRRCILNVILKLLF